VRACAEGDEALVYAACALCHGAIGRDGNGVHGVCGACTTAGRMDPRAGAVEWVYRPWALDITDGSGAVVRASAGPRLVRTLLLDHTVDPALLHSHSHSHTSRIHAVMRALTSPRNTAPFAMRVFVTARVDDNGFPLAAPDISLQALTLFEIK
jgi:hypothetical protein